MRDHPFSFRSGFSLGRGRCKVIAQIDELSRLGSTESVVLEWSEGKGMSGFEIDWIATRLWITQEPEPHLYLVGPSGIVGVAAQDKFSEEIIDESDQGPRLRGDIRDLRYIGDHLYVAGMSRQVYRRDRPGSWSRIDANVVQPLGELTVAGFNSIDGLSENDIYAAGFNGEIWHYLNHHWHQIESPTNCVIYRVLCVENDFVYACGQKGILLRGNGDKWEAIEHDATKEDLWGMEWFDGLLYVSSESGIYSLFNGHLEEVDTRLGEPWTFRHLHANAGALWSFGPKHLAWSDGIKWNGVSL